MITLKLNNYKQKPDLNFNTVSSKIYNSIYTISFYFKEHVILSLPKTINLIPWTIKNRIFVENILAPRTVDEIPKTLANHEFFCKKTIKGEILFFSFLVEENEKINLQNEKIAYIDLFFNMPFFISENPSMQKLNEVYKDQLNKFYLEICYFAEHKIWSQLELLEGSLLEAKKEELNELFPWENEVLSLTNPMTKLKERVFLPHPVLKINLDEFWSENDIKDVVNLLKIYEKDENNIFYINNKIKENSQEIKNKLLFYFNEDNGLFPYEHFNERFLKCYKSREELLHLYYSLFTKESNSFFSEFSSQSVLLSDDKDNTLLKELIQFIENNWIFYKLYIFFNNVKE